ncbi:MAG TPA: hypothetical protein VGH99_00815 [Pseudonocardia sp.]|jgi:heparin binding hemagglutinin HbhA
MAIALPTSADVRKARSRADRIVTAQWGMVRAPVLAWLGLGDLAVRNLRELPEQLGPERLRARADRMRDRARTTYREWADRGEDTVERVRAQPQVARALDSVENTDRTLSRRFEKLVDEFHDPGRDTGAREDVETHRAAAPRVVLPEKTLYRPERGTAVGG